MADAVATNEIAAASEQPPTPMGEPDYPTDSLIVQRVSKKGHVEAQVSGVTGVRVEGDQHGCQPIVWRLRKAQIRAAVHGLPRPEFTRLKLMTGNRATWIVKEVVDIDATTCAVRCELKPASA